MVPRHYRTDPQGWKENAVEQGMSHDRMQELVWRYENELAAEHEQEQRNAAAQDRRALARRPTVSPREAARLLGYKDASAVRRLIDRGKLPETRLSGGERRIPIVAVEAFHKQRLKDAKADRRRLAKEPTLTVAEAAAALGVQEATVINLLPRKLRGFKLSDGRWAITVAAVEERRKWLDERVGVKAFR
jgi:excisionase family DNA binding protein